MRFIHLEKKEPKQTYHVNLLKAREKRSAEVPVSSKSKVLMVQPVNLELGMEAGPKVLTEAIFRC